MGRAETITLLPLDRYTELMRINPAHFNQLSGDKAPIVASCDEVWDQTDRDELAWCIAQAEEMIAHELGYWPAPKFVTDETVPLALPGVRSDWENAELQTEWAHVQSYGYEVLTLVLANASVVYTDTDGDSYGREELATIGEKAGQLYGQPITDVCGDVCNVAVFFREADGAWDSADPRWEIRPLKVDNDAGLLYITAEASMFVKPSLWEKTGMDDPDNYAIDYDTGNFVETVDIYCRTVNASLPATLQWDGMCECSSACAHSTQTACCHSTDARRGFFAPRPAAGGNAYSAPTYASPPQSVKINYYAGYPRNRYCRMDPKLERAIVKLTNALLPETMCGFCDRSHQIWQDDRRDVDPMTVEAAGLPWDLYKQGALEAWRIVKMLAMGRGGKMGRGYRR